MHKLPLFLFLALFLTQAACSVQNPNGLKANPLPPDFVSGNQDFINAKVTQVIDGTTIEISDNNRTRRVRYADIEIPSGNALLVEQATRFNSFLVEGEEVQIEKALIESDSEGNLLAYIYTDGEMINASLVMNGYATVNNTPSPSKHRELLLQLENDARSNLRGIWRPDDSEPEIEPVVVATPSAIPSFSGGTLPIMPPSRSSKPKCDYSNDSQAVIKGKVDQSTGDKYFLVPSDSLYDETTVDESTSDRWFCKESEAIADGWQKSKN